MIKRIFSNKSIITIILIAACLVILYLAYTYRINQEINVISGVPIAAQTIPARTQIDATMIKTTKVASKLVTDDVIRSSDEINGKYVNYNTEIPEGSLFYKSQIVDWKSMPDSAWKDLKDNSTVFSLSVSSRTTYGNSIYPGDKIDLYLQTTDNNKLVYGKLIEGITVLAVKDENGNHIFGKSASQSDAAALIFEVDEDMFRLLKAAELSMGNGSLIPVPRNSNYASETNVSSSYLRQLIENKVSILSDDVVTNSDVNVNETE